MIIYSLLEVFASFVRPMHYLSHLPHVCSITIIIKLYKKLHAINNWKLRTDY